jgi:diguanylate cyclase (GGDEF)-like protein
MMITKKRAITYLIYTIFFLYLWVVLLKDYERIVVLGTSLFPIVIGLLSLSWVYRASKVLKGEETIVWKMISFGLVMHVIGNVIWFIGAFQHVYYQAPDISYVFWITAYILFLLALIYKMRLISTTITNNSYLFNSIIFIIVISASFIHYFIRPYVKTAESWFELIVIGLLYPVVDISVLFVATLLSYLSRHSKDRTVMLCLMSSFYLSLLGDFITAIMKTNNHYYQLFIEPLWVGSLLLIGFAALFAMRHKHKTEEVKISIDEKESSFPYISIFLLIILAFQSYHWDLNALIIGVSLVLFMIIGRNLFMIAKNRKLMLEYRKLAYEDSLTGLSNRSSFKLDLEQLIERANKNNSSFSILLIDLDRFKMINDTLGHIVGDQLLVLTSKRLRKSLEKISRIYRLGGDEFVVLIEDVSDKQCSTAADQIIEIFKQTFSIFHHEITITPSVGISFYPQNGKDSDSLFKAADAAMYLAKGKGRNNYQFYNSELNQVLTRKLVVENELRKAIIRKELELFYQPKFDLFTRKMIGMEALVRWNSKQLGTVSPTEFIPIAEETGLIVSIGEWVMRKAFQQNKTWQEQGFPLLTMSVNVSVQQFKHSHLIQVVKTILTETGLDPRFAEIEITESIMQNVEESKRVLTGLRELGLTVALDDFGTGYSSLHILKNLPINILKIDKTFIDDIGENEDHSIVKGIIDIAVNLQLAIVAEGIEHEYQVEKLANYHCQYGQGYLFSKPIPAIDMENLLLGQRDSFVDQNPMLV